MPDPHFTALEAQLADAHEEARRLALEVAALRAIVERVADADSGDRLGAVKIWDLAGRPGEAEGCTAEWIQDAARRVLGRCLDCNGSGQQRTDVGHGNILDEECSTCHPGPAAGEEKP